MLDPHTHSFLSDGVLLPEELVRRAEDAGYLGLGITDHAGISNIADILPALVRLCESLVGLTAMVVLPGVELTHLRPELFGKAVEIARDAGAKIVVAHGETIVEPVLPGTNGAAILAGVDVLAHPGLISSEDSALAAERGVRLEISGRKGHSLTNGHVLAEARRSGAKLVFGSDAHLPDDLVPRAQAERIALGCGMNEEEVAAMFANLDELFREKEKR